MGGQIVKTPQVVAQGIQGAQWQGGLAECAATPQKTVPVRIVFSAMALPAAWYVLHILAARLQTLGFVTLCWNVTISMLAVLRVQEVLLQSVKINSHYGEGIKSPLYSLSKAMKGEIMRTIYSAILMLACIGFVKAQETKYTVDFVADALDAAESQCDSLKFLCTFNTYLSHFDRDGNLEQTQNHQFKIECAYKSSKGYILTNRKEYLENKNLTYEIFKDALLCYGGKGTLIWDKIADEDGLTKAEIFPGFKDDQFFSQTNNPRSFIYNMGSHRWCDLLRSSDWDFKITESSDMDGVQTLKLEGRYEKTGGVVELWVSPDRSFLPVKYHYGRNSNDEVMGLHEFKDFTKLPNGLWFPRRIIMGGAEQYGIFIDNIDITPIPDELFDIKLPPNTLVHDHIVDTVYNTSGNSSIDELMDMTPEYAPQDIDAAEKALGQYVDDAQINSETENKHLRLQSTDKPAKNDNESIKTDSRKSFPVWIILLSSVIILLGGVFYVLSKRK